MSDVKGRDIKIDAFTLSFHGRLLIEGAEISLNYGQRYGLLGENGSGKVWHQILRPPFYYFPYQFVLVYLLAIHRRARYRNTTTH